jgi:phosphomethylpyrimidine synthase
LTQILKAREGKITKEIQGVAAYEKLPPEFIRDGVASGQIVITVNSKGRGKMPIGIGAGLKVKINANIGTSQNKISIDEELKKLNTAVSAGADTVMDLSTGGNLSEIRQEIIKNSPLPVGTVPVYQLVKEAKERNKSFVELKEKDFLDVVEKHAEDGVAFVTVHCGVTIQSIERLKKEGRILDIVSRGGVLFLEWMLYNSKDNPLYTHYDSLLAIAKKYDLILSLGDGLRPGCIADATDRSQIQELIILGELTQRAWDKGVQVMIEGPGHVPLHQIKANVLLEKELCHGAPFYVLGPLVTDIAPGYDHITSAIGGAVAAMAGADFLCYVTPSEHLSLPGPEEVKEGVIAARIAGHAADVAKGIPDAFEQDRKISIYRKKLDWDNQIKLAIDPTKIKEARKKDNLEKEDICTMCGDFCAIKRFIKNNKEEDFYKLLNILK